MPAIASGFSMVVLVIVNLSGMFRSPGSNCVDDCVVEYAKMHGVHISASELEAKADLLGMSKAPHDRSMLDAVKLLSSIGVVVTATQLRDVSNLDDRLPAIVYVPDPDGDLIGHLVIVVGEKRGGYSLLDPGVGFTPRVIEIPELRRLESSVLLTRKWAVPYFYLRQVVVFAIVVFGGSFVFLFLNNGLKRRGYMCLFAILFSGCGRPSTCVVKEAQFDFGDVIEPDSGKVLVHEFEIFNTGKDAKIVNKVASCTCVVFTDDDSEFLIPQGKSKKLTAGVSVGGKTGAFVEEIRLVFDDPNVEPILLRLCGIVLREPSSTQPLIQFNYRPGIPMLKYCTLSHQRRSNDKPMEIEDLRIISDLNYGLFSLGTPTRSEMVVEDRVVTDVWEVPVNLTNSKVVDDIDAVLSVTWKSRNDTTKVRLLARQAKSIELIEEKMVLIGSLGKQSVESIPLRILDSQNAKHVKVSASVDWCDVEVNADKSMLDLRLVPPRKGNHLINVTLTENDRSIGEFVVTVLAQ